MIIGNVAGARNEHAINLNSKVLVQFSSGETLTLTIVNPEHINPVRGFISYDSPLGSALLGKEKGDKISYSVGNRIFDGSILEVNTEKNSL